MNSICQILGDFMIRDEIMDRMRNGSGEAFRKIYDKLETLVSRSLEVFLANGDCVRLEVPGYIKLVCETLCPTGLSMAHWSVQNGDAMRDPEVVFYVDCKARTAMPVVFRNDYVGILDEFGNPWDEAPTSWETGKVLSCTKFCLVWFKNLRAQGFYDAEREMR